MRLTVGLIATFLLLLAGGWVYWRVGPPAPPPDVLSRVDPDVAARIQQFVTRARLMPWSAAAWGRLGMVYEAHDLRHQAIECYRVAERRDPGSAVWPFRLAVALGGESEVDQALEAIDRAIALNDSFAPAHWRKGMWLLERGSPQDAQAAFRRASELDKVDPTARLGLARALLESGQPEEAAAILEQPLLRSGPNQNYARLLLGLTYRRLGRADEADVLLKRSQNTQLVLRDPWTDELGQYLTGVRARLDHAIGLISSGGAAEALNVLEALRAEHPNHAGILNNLAIAYQMLKRPREALEALHAAHALQPERADILVNLAMAQHAANDLQAAHAALDQAAAAEPSYAKTHQVRSVILEGQGRLADAATAQREALRLDARDPSVRVRLGELLLRESKFTEAADQFSKALDHDSANAQAVLGLAEARLGLNQPREAEQALARAEALRATDARYYQLQVRVRQMLQQGAAP